MAYCGHYLLLLLFSYLFYFVDLEHVTVEVVMGHMRHNANNARRFVAAVLDELNLPEHADLVQARCLEGMVKMCISTERDAWSEHARDRMEWLFPGYWD